MKKITVLFLTLCIILSFTACVAQSPPDSTADSGKLSIVTTIFPYYDFAKNIAGEKADVKMLLSPGEEVHTYEPSPAEIIAIQECDLFIYNGGESDAWVESILSSIGTDVAVLKMMEHVTLLCGENDHDHQGDTDDHGSGEYDEHIWTSPVNADLLSAKIAETLRETDGANASYYETQYKRYSNALTTLDENIKQAVQQSGRNEIVVGDRFPFLYFVTAYGLTYDCAFPGCSSETEPSAETVARLSTKVKQQQIPVVFYQELSSNAIARVIAEATGAKTLLLHSCHNVSKAEFESGVTYISLMEQNLLNLKEALS